LISGHETDCGNGVVVARKGLCVLPLVLGVPYFDEEIGGASDWWKEKLVGRERKGKTVPRR